MNAIWQSRPRQPREFNFVNTNLISFGPPIHMLSETAGCGHGVQRTMPDRGLR